MAEVTCGGETQERERCGCLHLCICACVHACICASTYVCVCVCARARARTHACVCLYVCMPDACMYACVSGTCEYVDALGVRHKRVSKMAEEPEMMLDVYMHRP